MLKIATNFEVAYLRALVATEQIRASQPGDEEPETHIWPAYNMDPEDAPFCGAPFRAGHTSALHQPFCTACLSKALNLRIIPL